MRDHLADGAIAAKLPGMDDQRRPSIIEAEKPQYACFARDSFNLRCFLWTAPDRFLAEDMFASGRSRFDDFEMQIVGRGDIHDLHRGIFNDIMPARRGRFEAEQVARRFRPPLDIVRADDQPRRNAAVGEALARQAVRTGVDLSHPAHADYAYANLSHSVLFRVVIGRATGSCVPALRFTGDFIACYGLSGGSI